MYTLRVRGGARLQALLANLLYPLPINKILKERITYDWCVETLPALPQSDTVQAYKRTTDP